MIIKCKMCGGDLHPEEGMTTCECEFCGTVQTIPTEDGDKKANLFNRANRLRMNAEFDKAAAIYESITAEFPEEAEAYWGLCLCAYGIEYVDDPVTGEKKPTCHRTLPTSIMEDGNFEQACDNADAIARRIYREEAKVIDGIQRDILAIVSREAPYDVFICYKETADEGGRTEDSVIAQDIYDALTAKGLKVFFSRITLEDKLGQQYEPYIYAALTSAKVMVAVGTRFEYFDAVWVKNEWMRFLSMMKTDKSKTLIPCYKDLDAYDMPKEFKNLQGQDMGKIGAMQDLIRGIEKIIHPVSDTIQVSEKSNTITAQTEAFVRRASLFVESADWDKAIEYCEKALDIDPENANAYLIRELAERHCGSISQLAQYMYYHENAMDDDSLQKAKRFAGAEVQAQLDELERIINTVRNDQKKLFMLRMEAEEARPEWHDNIHKYERANQRAELLAKRIDADRDHTLMLDTAGKMHSTKCTNDEFDIFDYGHSACDSWTTRLVSFCETIDSVYGCGINGEILRTERKDPSSKECAIWQSVSQWKDVKEIIKSGMVYYGIMNDGTVKAESKEDPEEYHGEDKVDHLKGVVAYLGRSTRFGVGFFLCEDGTIKSSKYIGKNKYEDVIEEILSWTNIKQLLFFSDLPRAVGLRKDGTIVATKPLEKERMDDCFSDYLEEQKELDELLASRRKKRDELLATRKKVEHPIRTYYRSHYDNQIDELESWYGIRTLYNLGDRVIGLTKTGSVVSTAYYGEVEEKEEMRSVIDQLSEWKNIVYLAKDSSYTAGVTLDGQVKIVKTLGGQLDPQLSNEIAEWKQIVAIAVGFKHIVGIRRDGSLVAVGDNDHGSCNVSHMRMFNNYDVISEEIEDGIRKAKDEKKEIERKREMMKKLEEERKKRKRTELQTEKEKLTNELASLRGLFTGKRKKEIQQRLDEIERELRFY